MMNLIVICVDSWRADILGGRGRCNWIKAPVLADLARQSVVFDRGQGDQVLEPMAWRPQGIARQRTAHHVRHNVPALPDIYQLALLRQARYREGHG